ncbi:MAG: hypothetical protein ACI9JL_004316 [Paracoccaceae bacterium]|jgi:mono/diheme cytochrome c family protein
MWTGLNWAVLPLAACMWTVLPLDAASGPPTPAAPEIAAAADDEYQGMPPGNGRDETLGICGACHSIKLVKQQGLSRTTWVEVLEYMVEEHEMPELEAEDHDLIVDYLAKFYGPDRRARKSQN